MSVFYKKKVYENKLSNEDVEEDYDMKNPLFRNHYPDYAIKEKRRFMNKTGFYNIYVVHSGHDETIRPN